ncbi:hypothetical protein [Mucilaginibacter polytrichastri]|uniref:Uncharacterized protein n=1 Tax=Mucilaginibacter polytrichastri TaxID=1302689 RepID=A0A1Q5ZSK7_9SPHI|nr:hypothetical protein [Mucilaginibacter polytrichastri]OKS84752.1 hypothetical protein RG47T_0185 [Mucilaginibacter polytrichastri]SFT00735.1 hypothetical protein SAMN04487890_10854 [Mucilaginibacter polytrichastri]
MKNFTYLLLLVLFFTACKKGDIKPIATIACIDTLQHDIVSVNGVTKSLINQEISFNVSWRATNNCDKFVNFKQDTSNNTIAIKAYASHDSCTVCAINTNALKAATYKFKAAKAGTYYLKFYKVGTTPNDLPITDTLLVE